VDDLSGKVALVTGAASGMGLSIAKTFAAAGMKIALVDIDARTLAAAARTVREYGVDVATAEMDVSDRSAWATHADRLEAELGPVQLLVNNAGVSTLGIPFDATSPELWDRVIQINLTGVYNGIHCFLDRIRATGEGHIVNTGSIGGLLGTPGLVVYCASKFAVVGLSEALRAELVGDGIGVSVLCPAGVRTHLGETSSAILGLAAPTRMPGDGLPEGIDPADVGPRVLAAVRANDLYIFTHPELRPAIDGHHQVLTQGFDHADQFKA
jgi:NAD(P)-dependent dehydrogenase (short-subunit alcohol dehydrogenase family)